MKRKTMLVILAFEAIACVLLYFGRGALPGVFTAAMSFPFEQIGLGLRFLSLSGGWVNGLAVALYCALCLLPLVVLLLIKKRRKLRAEDGMLAVLSVCLFATLYLMINPGLMGKFLGSAAGQGTGKAILGSVVYSVLVGYAVMRGLRLFREAETARLQKYLALLLFALSMVFVYMAFGGCFGNMMDAIWELRAANVGNEHALGLSYGFLVLQCLANALPYGLDVMVALWAIALLGELSANRYSDASVAAAGWLSRLCAAALIIIVMVNVGFNLLQLLFLRGLMVIHTSVEIPLLSMIFVLVTLLLAQYVKENKRLKDDNDMFI